MSNAPPSLDEILNCIDRVYASALDPAQTPITLQLLNNVLRGTVAQIYSYDRASGAVLDSQTNEVLDETANAAYVTHWGYLDPRPVVLSQLSSGKVMCCHELFDRKYISGSAFYQDFFIPYGFRWALGGALHSSDGTSTVVAGLRSPDSPSYEPWAATILAKLLPHFERAAVLRTRLHQEATRASDLLHAIEHLPSACMLVNTQGKVQVLNAAAGVALAEFAAIVAGSFLRFHEPQTHGNWVASLKSAHQTQVAVSLSLRSLDSAVWQAHIVPWRLLSSPRDATDLALLFVTLERKGGPSSRTIQGFAATRGMTKAETEVLELLARGYSVKQIAQQRGASFHTVRSQITAILAKTDCRSQRQLLSLLR